MSSRQKKTRALLLIAIVIFAIAAFSVSTQTAHAQLLRPFGGYLTDVDYETCTCGFVIFTIYDKTTYSVYRIIGPWPGLDEIFLRLVRSIFDIDIPRIYYEYYAVWPGSDANVVGSYYPYPGASCLQFCQTGCCPVTGVGTGYLFQMGTSIFSNG